MGDNGRHLVRGGCRIARLHVVRDDGVRLLALPFVSSTRVWLMPRSGAARHLPQHHLLFSAHMYPSFRNAPTMRDTLQREADTQLPFIVGELGLQRGEDP